MIGYLNWVIGLRINGNDKPSQEDDKQYAGKNKIHYPAGKLQETSHEFTISRALMRCNGYSLHFVILSVESMISKIVRYFVFARRTSSLSVFGRTTTVETFPSESWKYCFVPFTPATVIALDEAAKASCS
jgi:hypothetical protein